MEPNRFNYTYRAPTEEQRQEIASIRRQYEPLPPAQQGLARLRALDARVKNIPTIAALIFGVLGFCAFGLGMSLCLHWQNLLWGIAVAAVGACIMAPAYPLYRILTRRLKEKHAPEILQLSAALLQEKTEK